MRVYSSSTKVSHPMHFSGHFNRLPDNGKLAGDLLIRPKRRKELRPKEWSFQQATMQAVLRARKFTHTQVIFSEFVILALNPWAVLSFMRFALANGNSWPFFTR